MALIHSATTMVRHSSGSFTVTVVKQQ